MRRLPWLLAAIYLALATAPALGQQSAANFCLNPNFSASTPGSTRFIACGAESSGVSTPLVVSGSLTPAGTQSVTGTGTAGTAATGVLTVQGIASGTALQVSLPAAGTSVVGTVAAGTSAATSLLTGGVYNSTTPTLTNGQQVARQVDTQGALRVNAQGVKKTYRAGAPSIVVTAAGTLFQIQGSASKTVTITNIIFSGVLTTATGGRLRVFKNTAAETGGTSAVPGIIPLDSAQPNSTAATAAVLQFSTSGTPGASLGPVDVRRIFIAPATAAGQIAEFNYGTRNTQAIVLRGTGEYLTLEQNFSAYVGALFDVSIEWTEE